MRFISSASLGGQNISSSLLTATYTATAVDAITTRLFAAGISGSANYLAFITLQRLGTGSTYQVIPVTSASVKLGTTAIALTTIPVPVDNTDVMKVYLQGSASDTSSPSLWTYFYGESTCTLLANSAVTAAAIASSAFTNAKFATGAIGIDTLAGSSIAASTFAGSAITNAVIASCAMANNVFKAGALGVGILGASALAASNIGGSAFDSTVYKTGAIAVGVLGASVIGASNIAGSALDNTVFKTDAVGPTVIASSTLTNAKFAAGAVGVGILGASAIAASNIGGSAFNVTVFDSDVDTATAESNWGYSSRTLTQAAAVVTSILTGSVITVQRGDSLNLSVTGLGNISSREEFWFTVKEHRDDADANSILMVTTGSKLRYVQKGAPSSSNNGIITVDNATLGNVTLTVSASEMDDLLPARGLVYDFQMRATSGSVSTLSSGVAHIVSDITRSV